MKRLEFLKRMFMGPVTLRAAVTATEHQEAYEKLCEVCPRCLDRHYVEYTEAEIGPVDTIVFEPEVGSYLPDPGPAVCYGPCPVCREDEFLAALPEKRVVTKTLRGSIEVTPEMMEKLVRTDAETRVLFEKKLREASRK